MSLQEQITTDMKEAMKAKEADKLSTLRLLSAALKNKQIDVQRELTDDDVLAVINTQMKQLADSLESAKQAGREEMAASAEAEMELLKNYLPEQLSDEDLEAAVKQAIEETGATSSADMGKVMGAAMGKVKGQADGNRVKDMVAKLLV